MRKIHYLDVNTLISSNIRIRNVDIFAVKDLQRLRAYAKWKDSIIHGLKAGVYSSLLSERALKYFVEQLKCRQHIVCMSGEGKILEYYFPNKERKLITIWNDEFVIQNDTYWLKYYPFFKQPPAYETMIWLNEDQISYLPLENNYTNIFLSHNDHFGHFIADNFPSIAFMGIGPLKSLLQTQRYSAVHANYKESIINSLQILKNTPLETIRTTESDKVSYRKTLSSNPKILENIPSSLTASTFLWNQIKGRILNRENLINTSIYPEKIFLIRGGEFKSRIFNYQFIRKSLESYGFKTIDPCAFSINLLVSYLYNAKYIIAESGSTTLNAALFSNESTKIISLCSRRLLTNPSEGMIRSGLPYLLCFANKVSLVTGELIKAMPIESSDICKFNIDDIINELRIS